MKLFYSILLFIFVFLFGFFFFKPDKVPQRKLASIPETINTDYSDLSGGSLQKAVTNRVLKDSYISRESGDIHINLPHFQMMVDEKRGRSACEYFKKIQVKIHADGVAVSGEKPSLFLESTCIIGQDNYIQPLKIPSAMFLDIDPIEISSHQVEYDQTFISFASMPNSWPSLWLVSEAFLMPYKESDLEMRIKFNQGLEFSQNTPLRLPSSGRKKTSQ